MTSPVVVVTGTVVVVGMVVVVDSVGPGTIDNVGPDSVVVMLTALVVESVPAVEEVVDSVGPGTIDSVGPGVVDTFTVVVDVGATDVVVLATGVVCEGPGTMDRVLPEVEVDVSIAVVIVGTTVDVDWVGPGTTESVGPELAVFAVVAVIAGVVVVGPGTRDSVARGVVEKNGDVVVDGALVKVDCVGPDAMESVKEGVVGSDVDAKVEDTEDFGPATTEGVGAGKPVVEKTGIAVVIPLSTMDSVFPVGGVSVDVAVVEDD